MPDRDGRPERLADLLPSVAGLLADLTHAHRTNGEPTMTLTADALRSPVPSPAPITPAPSRAAALDATRPQEPASGSSVDNWHCDWCGHTRDLTAGITCPCQPATPRTLADIAARHRDAVRRARPTR